MTAGGLETELIDLLAVFIIAAGVGVAVAKYVRVPYTIALLVAGFVVSLLDVQIGIELTHDIILLVLLPPLLFEGAATTDLSAFRENVPLIMALAVGGLLASVVFVGVITATLFDGFSLLLGLLFAAIILPTDPVSVLALFEDIGAPERLAVIVEGESLVNDGVGVVVFSALFAMVEAGATVDQLTDPVALAELGADIAVTSLGGAVVGAVAGYAVYRVMYNLDEHMTEIVLTIVLAYGAFLLAEHYLHVSGVIATVVAGLLIGNRGREYAMSAQTKISVFNTWRTGAFIVNTFIFIVIGAQTPLESIVDNAGLLVPSLVVVLVGRALVVYPITELLNRTLMDQPVSRSYQHVLVWGGLHASIPIALVLGLPATLPDGAAFPQREQIRVMVFGVAAFSLVVQGLTIRRLVDHLGIITTTEEERLYQLLLGRARAVDAVLDEAERMHDESRIPTEVFDRFTTEYAAEKEDLNRAISQLLTRHPEIREREQLVGERQLLKQEQSAISSAEHDGLLTTDIADDLLREVNIKLSRVRDGQTTVVGDPDEEGYEEFWRRRVRESGLFEEDVLDGEPGEDRES